MYDIDTTILYLIGDLISGHLHDELLETNYMSPTEAIYATFEYLVSSINTILKETKMKELHIICCSGNHGRTTQKIRNKTGQINSFEWLLYKFLVREFANNNRVFFKLPEGYHNFFKIYDWQIRAHHGDSVRYMGGIGGVHIPLRKAISQWDKARRADLDVMGHWHQYMSDNSYIINGSLIGYNEYAIKIKADYEEPKQVFFLVHPVRKKTLESPIFC
jgi:hypothetical protein